MDQVLSLRPFVPARDYPLSKRFYVALGFAITHEDADVTLLKTGAFSFILQNFDEPALAHNLMVQLLVRDADAWWRATDPERIAAEFDTKPPKPPEMQPWGLKVGFIHDPSGVLWHVAEAPF